MSQETERNVRKPTKVAAPWQLRLVKTGDVLPLAVAMTMGREGADVTISDPRMSRKHATLTPRANGVSVEDHGSTNGSFVDGRRISSETVDEGAVLRVGETIVLIERAYDGFVQDDAMIGLSAPIGAVLSAIREVAKADINVLVMGETGTGKEVVAQRLHALSGRSGQCIGINTAAIPATLAESSLFGHKKGSFSGATADADGCFVAADGGTLFLDEIGELSLELQPKLLRALDTGRVTPVGSSTERAVNVRVVAATNVELSKAVDDGKFRRDLYARVSEYVIHLPPLRERRADVLPILQHFMGKTIKCNADFLEALLVHDWPMNVREVRSLAKRLSLSQDAVFELGHLPEEMHPLEEAPQAPTQAELVQMLTTHKGNLQRIAKHYGKGRAQVYRWMEKYALKPEDFR